MKFENILKIGLVVVSIWTTTIQQAWATSEIDEEIDRLSVELRPAPHKNYKSQKPMRKQVISKGLDYRQSTVPSSSSGAPATVTSVETESPIVATTPQPALSSPKQLKALSAYQSLHSTPLESSSTQKISNHSSLLSRFTLLPLIAISTFDGQDQPNVSPNNGGSGYSSTLSGALLTDINFGSQKIVLETGIGYFRLGAEAGYNNAYQYSPYGSNNRGDEIVTLNYLGIPLHLKWLLLGSEQKTNLYLKGGAIAAILMKSEYQNLSGPSYMANRYGNFSSFDAILDAEIGMAVPIYKSFGLAIEAGYFHGTLPVSSNYTIYNTGFIGGLGLTYVL